MTFGWRALARLAAPIVFAAAGLTGCGGGGDATASAPPSSTVTATATKYRHIVVVGLGGEQALLYTPGSAPVAATIAASTGSALLPAGTMALGRQIL